MIMRLVRIASGSSLRTRAQAELPPLSDLDDVASAVFASIAVKVEFAFACLATIDPASGLITRAVKSQPLEIGDQEFAAAEYGEPDVNQFTEIGSRPSPVGVLSVDTDGHPESCRRMRDYMTPQFGFSDELRVACRAAGLVWGALALYRTSEQPRFTRSDGQAVVRLHEPIADALRRLLIAPSDAEPDPVQPVVLVLDVADRVDGTSSSVEALIDTLGGWDHGALPAPLLAAAAAARTAGGATTSRVRTAHGGWLAIRAVPISSLSGLRSVVLTAEAPPSAAIGRLRLAAHGLTAREGDIVQQVLLGASTKEMAAALHISAHTVQDHLKAVFGKLGIGSRRELIAQFVD